MFDVFDIQMPIFAVGSGFEVRRHESTFGPSDDEFMYCNGMKFARVLLANQAYSDIERWAGSSERADWTVLSVAMAANNAVTADRTWAEFCAALILILEAHSFWRVICESDCEQHPIQKMRLSPEGLAHHLNLVRTESVSPIALEVTPF